MAATPEFTFTFISKEIIDDVEYYTLIDGRRLARCHGSKHGEYFTTFTVTRTTAPVADLITCCYPAAHSEPQVVGDWDTVTHFVVVENVIEVWSEASRREHNITKERAMVADYLATHPDWIQVQHGDYKLIVQKGKAYWHKKKRYIAPSN